MNAPPQKSPMPYGILPTDKPYPVELEGCSRCGRELEAGLGSSSVWSVEDGKVWIYCAICTGSTGFTREGLS